MTYRQIFLDIHDYVTKIVLFKPDDSWVLVIVQFLDGSERWGTIKSERYKKSEFSNDSRQFTEIKYSRTVGQYTFEEFDQLVKDRGMVSEFSPYEFRIEKE